MPCHRAMLTVRARAPWSATCRGRAADFFGDLKEDVTDEVSKHGDVLKCAVLPRSAGHMLFRFDSEQAAAKCVAALNNRWFAGKQISADTIDAAEFEALLADAR